MLTLPRLSMALMCVAALSVPGRAGSQGAAAPAGATVVIQTELGDIRVVLDTAHAAATTANFLRYVDQSFYDDSEFYRTVTAANQPDNPVKIAVIQGGLDDESVGFEPVKLERTSVTGLRHLDGVISMARNGPDTASTEFFICVGDQPELDFGGRRNPDGQGFAAFGRVVDGMDVVRRIHQAHANGQRLEPPIKIKAIRRVG